jgi:hypothetical protein
VNEVLDLTDREAVCLGALHNKPAAYFLQQLHQGGRFTWKKHKLNIWNAAEHCMGLIEKEKESKHDSLLGKTHYWRSVDLEITAEERQELKAVVVKNNELGGPKHAKNLDQKDHDVLTKQLNATRNHVHTAPHARPLGASWYTWYTSCP